ncbi:hypothetical protein UG55_10022 [Frankia sp. EI5c]|nr:hypothetical protein UG55_10022 [Frankia sp. EI5c]
MASLIGSHTDRSLKTGVPGRPSSCTARHKTGKNGSASAAVESG